MHKAFGIDNDTWAALSAIGSILAAIGTVAAVIVALRLARRDYYPRLTITNAIMQTVEPVGPSGKPLEIMTIGGTNVGHTTVTVKGIFWTLGWFRKQTFITLRYHNPYSTPLPKEITHGQQVLLAQPLSEFVKGLDTFVRHLKKRWFGRFLIRSLRAGLYTSIGIDFSCRADTRVRALLEAIS
jgi:hypothetical protein